MKPASVKSLFACVATLALCIASNQASAAIMFINPNDPGPLLSDLIANQGTPDGEVIAGDKRFSNFQYADQSADPRDMPGADAVRIIPVVDDVTGHYGIRISGGFSDSAASLGPSNAEISFDVDVLDPSFEIIGVQLSGDPVVVGNDDEGFVTVIETFEPKDSLGDYDLDIFDDATSGTQQRFDSLTFNEPGPIRSLRVLKDITANAGDGPVANVTSIDQLFVQRVIPEPSSYVLMSMMGLAIVVLRYRFG